MLIMKKLIMLSLSFLILIVIIEFTIVSLGKTINRYYTDNHLFQLETKRDCRIPSLDKIKTAYIEFLYPDKKIAELENTYRILNKYILKILIIIFCINIFVLIVYFIILKTRFKFSDFDFKNHKNQIIQTAISILSLLFIAFGDFDNDEDILILLKIVVSAISFYFVWLMKDKKSFFFLLFILLGILFNPLIPFGEDFFDQTILWLVISFAAIIIFFTYANLNFKKQKKD